MSDPSPTFETFEQFWPHFLKSHRKSSTRWAHVAVLATGIGGLALGLQRRSVWPVIAGAVGATVLANGAHRVLEGNTPENTGQPLWAARAVVRMCVRTVTGSIKADMERVEATA